MSSLTLQKGILDPTFGVSGELFFSSKTAILTEYYGHYFATDASGIFMRDLLGNEIYRINTNPNIKINDYIRIDTEPINWYVCGKDFSTNQGILINFSTSEITQITNVSECHHIFDFGDKICILSSTDNQIILTQYNSSTDNYTHYTILDNEFYAIPKKYILYEDLIYIFVEFYNTNYNVYQTKIITVDSNLNIDNSVQAYQDLSKNILVQDVVSIDPALTSVVVYISQPIISSSVLPSNNILFASLNNPSIILSSFSIPNYFVDCISFVQGESSLLMGYAYESQTYSMNYITIQIDSSFNLNTSFNQVGYHVEAPITPKYLSPINEVNAVSLSDSTYLMTPVDDGSGNEGFIISKFIYPEFIEIFSSLQNNQQLRIVDEYGVSREITVLKPQNGELSLSSEVNVVDACSNLVVFFSSSDLPNTSIYEQTTNLFSFYVKYFDTAGNPFDLTTNPVTLQFSIPKSNPLYQTLYISDLNVNTDQYQLMDESSYVDQGSSYLYTFEITRNSENVVSGNGPIYKLTDICNNFYILSNTATQDLNMNQITDISGQDLSGVDLSGVVLPSTTKFINSNLTSANLNFGTLNYTQFTNTILTGANFSFANLSHISFTTSTSLLGTNFTNATINHMNFNNATDISGLGPFASSLNVILPSGYEIVNQYITTTSKTSTSISFTVDYNSVIYGETVEFTFTVSPQISGTINLMKGSDVFVNNIVFTGTSDTVNYYHQMTPVTNYSLTATFTPDDQDNYLNSVSLDSVSISVNYIEVYTDISFNSPPPTNGLVGEEIFYNICLKNSGIGIPNLTVILKVDGTKVDEHSTDSFGNVTLSTTRNTPGTYNVQVFFEELSDISFKFMSSSSEIIALQIQNPNQPPTDISLNLSTIYQHQPIGTEVGTFTTTDPDVGDSHVYSLVGGTGDSGNSYFDISNNKLRILQALSGGSYSIRVQSQDPSNNTFEAQFNIPVRIIPIVGLTGPVSVVQDENNPYTVHVQKYQLGDFPVVIPPGAGVTAEYIISTTLIGSIKIVEGTYTNLTELRNAIVNVKKFNNMDVFVDGDRLRFESLQTLVGASYTNQESFITLLNTYFKFNLLKNTILQNNHATVYYSDSFIPSIVDVSQGNVDLYIDNQNTPLTQSVNASGNSIFDVSFNSTGSHQVKAVFPTQGVYDASESQVLYLSVSPSNSAPTDISLNNLSIAENNAVGAVIGTLSTVDPDDGNTFTYSLVGGETGSFDISGSLLKAKVSFNYETQSVYPIQIRTTDQGGLTKDVSFNILITNVNEGPTDISLNNLTVLENQPIGTQVGIFTTTDPDATDSHTYLLVEGTGSTGNTYFDISNNKLLTKQVLNYESATSHSIRVQTKDSSNNIFEKVFTISVMNVNEGPTDISLSSSLVYTNQPIGAEVGTFSNTDPDATDSHTYSLVEGAGSTGNSYFDISNNKLRIKQALSVGTYSIRVQTQDSSNNTFEKVFPITAEIQTFNTMVQITSSQHPQTVSQQVTLTAHVTSGGINMINGTVDVSYNGSIVASALILTESGLASYTFTESTNGYYKYDFIYSGYDSGYEIYNPSQNSFTQRFIGGGGGGAIGSDPHVYTLFGNKYDFKQPSSRKWYDLFKHKDLNIKGHFSGLKQGIFFDHVKIRYQREELTIDFNSKKIKNKTSNIIMKENVVLDHLKYKNQTDSKKVADLFQPKKMTMLEIKDNNYTLNLYVDFITRYVHFRFPDQMPREEECSGLMVKLD